MSVVDQSVLPTPLATRLKVETTAAHEAMHALMGELSPFADRDRYARFVTAQYVFQCRVDALCANEWIGARVPDLDRRGRAGAARADLIDLGADVPTCDDVVTPGSSEPRALGWLYVSEGSTLGAAFLFKQAQTDLDLSADFGARNLAGAPEGRAQSWRAFVAAINAAGLSEPEQQDVIGGAQEAFAYFAATLTGAFEGAAALNTQTYELGRAHAP